MIPPRWVRKTRFWLTVPSSFAVAWWHMRGWYPTRRQDLHEAWNVALGKDP